MFLQIQLRQFCAAPPVKLQVKCDPPGAQNAHCTPAGELWIRSLRSYSRPSEKQEHLVRNMFTVHRLVNYEQDHCSQSVVKPKHLVRNLLTTVHCSWCPVNNITAVKCISAAKVKVKARATVHQLVPCEQHQCSQKRWGSNAIKYPPLQGNLE